MDVLVTGANGFIGSHLTRVLLEEERTVYALVRPGSDLRRLRGLKGPLHLIQGSLVNPETVLDRLGDTSPFVCCHLAWYAVPGQYWTARQNVDSLTASLRFVEALLQIGCRRLLITGTCSEYAEGFEQPSEFSPTDGGRSLYTACKLALKQVVEHLAMANKACLLWTRLFYLYGPLEDSRRLVPSAINALLRGEEFRVSSPAAVRDFLHVEDVATALARVAYCGESGCFNIGSGMPTAVGELVAQIGDLLGRSELVASGPGEKADPAADRIVANNRRLIELGWTPRYDLCKGLGQTIDWWKHHGSYSH